MVLRILLYLFYFLSGFAVLPWTKIGSLGNIQLFVVIAILIIIIGSLYTVKMFRYGNAEKSYLVFVVASLPALFIGYSVGRADALYFYIYTLIPILLMRMSFFVKVDFYKALLLAQLSLLVVIVVGWAIRMEYLPMTFLNSGVIESEFKLGYWGVSYTESTRNHDYMYVFSCAVISLYLRQKSGNYLTRGFQVVVFFVCEVTLLASMSRCAMLICILLLLLFYITSDKIQLIVFHVPLAILLIYMLPSFVKEYDTTYRVIFNSIFNDSLTNHYGTQFSNVDRIKIYTNAIKMILVNPVGYGIQNYMEIAKGGGGSAENAYLTVLAERGWLAGASFVLFLALQYFKGGFSLKLEPKRLNTYLIPVLALYFLFNYEFMSYSNVFLFYLVFISDRYMVMGKKGLQVKHVNDDFGHTSSI